MEPTLHHINVNKTARYFTLGQLNKDTKIVYFALHGYGQQAQKFVHKFDHLSEDTFVIVPEALSRFYWDESKGITGASWMTKDDRMFEIQDYCNYLEVVFKIFSPEIPDSAKLVLLGFSQGGATAMRFLLLKKVNRIDVLQIWASEIPLDLSYEDNKSIFEELRFYFIYGENDEYISVERINQFRTVFSLRGLNPQIVSFDGKHEIDRSTLLNLHEIIVNTK